jgi:hypothetical protein
MRLINSNIPRNPHLFGNRAIATITLRLRTVSKEGALCWLGYQLGALLRRKKKIANTPKSTEDDGN